MVRDGNKFDLDAVVDMAREFWKHTMYKDDFDPDHVRFMASMALDHGLMAVLVIGGVTQGFCAAIKAPLLANASVLTATEIAWWVNPEARKGRNGLSLMKHIERMAQDQGVKYWNMVVMESCQPEVGAAIYEARGYKKSETSYTRIL